MIEELKPCPFCGESDFEICCQWNNKKIEEGKYSLNRVYFLFCCKCGVPRLFQTTEKELIAAWNHRPAEDALKAEQEALIRIHQKENAEHDSIIQTLKKQLAASYDQNNAAFLLGMDQMNSLVGEKNDEIKRLKAELAELQYIMEQFFNDWYSEDGCPKQKDKNFICHGEEENESTAEFHPGECSWYQTKCWVEYYRWKYRQAKEQSK